MKNILVLCTGNSARSVLLEAAFNAFGGGRVRAFSAGSKPTGEVHPETLKLLAAQGYETSGLRSKSWDVFSAGDENAPQMDIVITVCGSAAGETCPMWPARAGVAPLRAHWGVEDPAAALPETQPGAFATAWDILHRRAIALLEQDLETMSRPALTRALNAIGDQP